MATPNPTYRHVSVKHCEHCSDAFVRGPNQDSYNFRKKRFCSAECAAYGSRPESPSLTERLFVHTKIQLGGCWLWEARKTAAGYGVFSYENRSVYAHRVSFELHNGPIPEGMYVCHKCDVRNCVNPDHLFAGTQADNVHDMQKKGRGRYSPSLGQDHGCSKLTDGQVLEIRASRATAKECAEAYGVSDVQIYNIRNRKSWKHLP